MSMLEHLYELRDRIIKSAIAIAVGAVVAWFLYPQIFEILLDPYCDLQGSSVDDCLLLQTEPLEGFSVRLKIAGYGGIALAMPVLLWQVWRFVTPGLYSHEKKWAYPFVFAGMALFLLGAGLAFYSLTPALEFLISVGERSTFAALFAIGDDGALDQVSRVQIGEGANWVRVI